MVRVAAVLAGVFLWCGSAFAMSERDAHLRALCKELSQRIVAHNAAIEAEKKSGHGVTGTDRQIIFGRFSLDRISEKAEPGPGDVREVTGILANIVKGDAALYGSLLSDPTLRAALLEAEKMYGVEIFATEASSRIALAVVDDLQDLASYGLIPDEPRADDADEAWPPFSQREGVQTGQELAGLLRAMHTVLADAARTPVPRPYAPNRLREATMYMSQNLTARARVSGAPVIEELMRYMAGHGSWYGYEIVRLFSMTDQPDHALAARLGETYLQQFCTAPADAAYTCLNVLSFLQGHFHSLHDEERARKASERLAAALESHRNLQWLMRTAAGTKDDDQDRLQQLRGDLERVVRPLDFMQGAGDPAQMWSRMMEWQAMSYWVTRAAGGQLRRLTALVPRSRGMTSMDEDMTAMFLLGGGFAKAVELHDTRTALDAVAIIKALTAGLAERRNESIESVKLAQLLSTTEVMELGVMAVAERWQDVERVAQSIQAHAAPHRFKGRLRGPSGPCMPAIEQPVSALIDDPQQYFEDLWFGALQMELNAAIRLKKRIASDRVRALFEHDVLELYRRPEENRSAFGESRRGEGKVVALTPAEFLANWTLYSKALAPHGRERAALAATAKCLLAQPEFLPRLVTTFTNADAEERTTLGDALERLLDDSGTVPAHGATVSEADFQLLQVAAILQANDGLLAATARAAFADEATRERVRRDEADISRLRDRMASFRGLASVFSSKEMGSMGDLVEVSIAHPKAYARYEEIKQQSTVTLKALGGALRPGEAAVLFVPAEKRLLAVVIRHDRATMARLPVGRPILRRQVEQLLASLRFSAAGGATLPPDYRADLAWSLYKSAVRPLEKELAGVGAVYVIGGAELSRIPFQALVTAAPPAQSRINFASYRRLEWLGDRYVFVSLPSARALVRSAGIGRTTPGKLLVVGEPAVAISTLRALRLDSMPETARLLRRSRMPDDYAPLLGRDASVASLLAPGQRSLLTAADIVLFNSHALPAGEGERYGTREAAIVLAPSGAQAADGVDLLNSAKVMELNMQVRLIMLLACATASGRTVDDAQPYAGLVNAFFYAGADTVLATNQPVDSAVTEDLAVSFLRHLRDERLSSAMALQKAVADIRCSGHDAACTDGDKAVRAHPAYWSHFTLVGSGR